MHLGNGNTRREKPRKAFDAYKENYSKKVDFGESSIPTGQVYRRKGVEGKSWFWIVVKLTILLLILFGAISVIVES